MTNSEDIVIIRPKRYCDYSGLIENIDENSDVEKYFYKLKITYGFIVGVIVDQILPGTFGLPIRMLKKFGKVLYCRSIRLNKFTNNWFIKGFLEQ